MINTVIFDIGMVLVYLNPTGRGLIHLYIKPALNIGIYLNALQSPVYTCVHLLSNSWKITDDDIHV